MDRSMHVTNVYYIYTTKVQSYYLGRLATLNTGCNSNPNNDTIYKYTISVRYHSSSSVQDLLKKAASTASEKLSSQAVQ